MTQVIIPLTNNIKLVKKALQHNSIKEDVKLVSFQENKETYLGVESNVMYVSNVRKEESKTKIFFDEEEIEIKENVIYRIEYYHNFLISYQEVEDYE